MYPTLQSYILCHRGDGYMDIGYALTAGWSGEVLTRFEPGNFRTASEWSDHAPPRFCVVNDQSGCDDVTHCHVDVEN